VQRATCSLAKGPVQEIITTCKKEQVMVTSGAKEADCRNVF